MGAATAARGQAAASALPLADEPALWTAARANDAMARARLIEAYLPYCRMLAAKLFAQRSDYDVEFGDYLQFGTVGLIESVDRFDATRAVLFKTYAAHRIQGAILNGLEQLSEKRGQVSARRQLQAERRDSAKAALEVPTHDLFQQLAEMAASLALGYMLDNAGPGEHEEPAAAQHQYSGIEMAQLRARVQALVSSLPQRERLVIKYHYLNQVPFHTIADTMGITKGRVSQIHRHAIDLLRSAMRSVKACDVAW
jgi:RNA polymerase sigma factor for flagellar operon FliA